MLFHALALLNAFLLVRLRWQRGVVSAVETNFSKGIP
jgi:hypothetical protein